MDTPAPKAPEVGDIVLYTVRDGQRSGETRAAIITRTFHQPGEGRPNWSVNLTLFPDQSNHAMHEELHASSALYDETGKKGTWRYKSPDAADISDERIEAAFAKWAFKEKEKDDAARVAAKPVETAAGSTPLHGKKKS